MWNPKSTFFPMLLPLRGGLQGLLQNTQCLGREPHVQ